MAGDANFNIDITAKDKFSQLLDRVHSQFGKMSEPLQKATEAAHKFGESTHFEEGVHHAERFAEVVDKVTEKLGGIERPLSVFTGFGSAAELAFLATGWAESGEKIELASRRIGIGGTQIQSFARASELLGVNSDDAVAGLQSLGDTMEGAQFGRNPQALVLMNKLGIQLHRTKDGAVDSADGMMQLADAIQKLNGNPQVQRQITDAFGVTAMLPVLQKGRKGLEDLQDEVKRTGAVMSDQDIAKGSAFIESVRTFGDSLVGVKNDIAANASAFTPWIDHTSQFLNNNRHIIASTLEVGTALAAFKATKWALPVANAVLVKPAIKLLGGVPRALLTRGGLAAAEAAESLGLESLGGALLGVAAAAEATSAALFAAGIGAAALLGKMAEYAYDHWSDLKKDRLTAPGDISPTAHMNWLERLAYNGGKMLYNGGDALRQGFGLPANGMDDLTPPGTGGSPAPGQPSNSAPSGTTGVPESGQPSNSAPSGTAGVPESGQPSNSAPGARGLRNNNPGNLRGWNPAGSHDSGGFDQFPTMDAGISAASRQLLTDQREGIDTLSGIIGKWAPASDGNDTAAYIADVARRTGIDPNQHLDLKDPKVQSGLLQGIFHREGNGGISTDEILRDILEAIKEQTDRGASGQTVHAPTPQVGPSSLAQYATPGNIGDSSPKFGP